ncbi:DNA-cytosine methyltransferase [Rhizobium sp. PP-F2F-G36]|nr:DNA-cytosine methyltransferase [Rhizobium sp. PP-F2F-G36]
MDEGWLELTESRELARGIMGQTAIDLYSGCGGMSAGAAMAIPGLEVKWALDIDENATRTFRKAHPKALVDCCDVSAISANDVIERAGIDKIDWFFAGPTCQAVSTMGVFHLNDPRNALFVHFIRLLDGFTAAGRKPAHVVMENVPGVVYGKNLIIVKELFKLFKDRGYHVFADIVNMADYGLPQLRNRFFLIASVDPIHPTFPKPTHSMYGEAGLPSYVSVSEAIGDISDIPAERGSAQTVTRPIPTTEFQKFVALGADSLTNHWTNTLAEINRKRISKVPQGGSWKDIPPELLPDRFRKVRLTDYATLYGRLHSKSPAYTISAGFGNVTSGCFTHPTLDRALSVREGARLQGFPDSFEFTGPRGAQYRQVGNAVPPFFMNKLVRHLMAGSDGVQARITSEALASGRKLPPMVRRFMNKKNDSERSRDGYGAGTYWPAGWGKPIAADEVAANGYRLAAAVPRFRRRDEWRVSRDTFSEQDIAKVYEDQLREGFSGTVIAIPLIKKGKMDAIDRAMVRIFAIVTATGDAFEIQAPVRYLRARLRLLHEKLVSNSVIDLPEMEIDDEEGIIRLGRGSMSTASLTFEDTDMLSGSEGREPHLVLHIASGDDVFKPLGVEKRAII